MDANSAAAARGEARADLPPLPPGRTAYKIADVCKALGVSRSTVYRAVQLGQLNVIRLGNRICVTRDELARVRREGMGTQFEQQAN